jgi:hypothetical protein
MNSAENSHSPIGCMAPRFLLRRINLDQSAEANISFIEFPWNGKLLEAFLLHYHNRAAHRLGTRIGEVRTSPVVIRLLFVPSSRAEQRS